MSNNYITVPIRVEGKFLDFAAMAASPFADFSKLPWNDGMQDINSSIPFLSDGIISNPFEDRNTLLGAGLHLHFVVPQYLGQHVPASTGLANAGKIPAAPNRWLITKTFGTQTAQWIIESDYVYPQNSPPTATNTACIIPFNQGQPYRYMGRTTPLSTSRPAGDTFKSLNNNAPLTIAGYGNINFSSFYPNCMGVFGFYDPAASIASSAKYSILGWNADATDDLLSSVIASLISAANPNPTIDQINQALVNAFNFQIAANGAVTSFATAPRTIFYGEFFADNIGNSNLPELQISIGNTSTEALSAMVASNLASSDAITKTVIEEQLESILLFSKLDHLATDTGPKFLEARHAKGFKSAHHGYLWKVVSQSVNDANSMAGVSSENPSMLLQLPPALASLLHVLNLAQFAYDTNVDQINSLQLQLYFDWCKYMRCAYPTTGERDEYPDSDHLQYFIANYSIPELNNLMTATGVVSYDATGNIPTAMTTGDDLANQLCEAWSAVNSALNADNSAAGNNNLSLVAVAGPRYWEANNPVILISGLELDASDSADFAPAVDNYLSATICQSVITDLSTILTQGAPDILAACSGTSSYVLSKQVWNPFLLDWQVNVIDTNLQDVNGAFDAQGIENNFSLDQFGPDFIAENAADGNMSIFSGSAIMSNSARRALAQNLQLFVANSLTSEGVTFVSPNTVDDFLTATSWSVATAMLVISATNPDAAAIVSDKFANNPLFTAWSTYQFLLASKVIAQTLNGFNRASIMQKKVAQLPIAEPIGFAEAQNFTAQVKSLTQNNRDMSPITAYDFNPVRSGKMSLNQLSLIDNFGIANQVPAKDDQDIVVAETLMSAAKGLFLRPRLAQPSRLNFRWLSATPVSAAENNFEDHENIVETNDHPDTSPICGWLIANYLDNSLCVYDPSGAALGYIDSNVTWNSVPWSNQASNAKDNITNEYLLNVVLWLIGTYNPANTDGAVWNDFLIATQVALDNVAPASANLFNTQALLMGRPMAVVRSRISFQVQGLPVIEQSWSAMLVDLNNCDSGNGYGYANRFHKNWPSMQLPCRIGEHQQLNDGLVGYWIEDDGGNLGAQFIAPEVPSAEVSGSDPTINSFTGKNYQTQWMAPNDSPVNMTMLLDPRGVVNATTGLLPTKTISIPPQYYLPALKQLNMWFYTSPLIQPATDVAQLFANLPNISGYSWQWWDKFNGVTPIKADTATQNLHANSFVMEGWLALVPTDQN